MRTSYPVGIGRRKASMPMKCVDQMPAPIDIAPPASQNHSTLRPRAALTREARFKATNDAFTATMTDSSTTQESYVPAMSVPSLADLPGNHDCGCRFIYRRNRVPCQTARADRRPLRSAPLRHLAMQPLHRAGAAVVVYRIGRPRRCRRISEERRGLTRVAWNPARCYT